MAHWLWHISYGILVTAYYYLESGERDLGRVQQLLDSVVDACRRAVLVAPSRDEEERGLDAGDEQCQPEGDGGQLEGAGKAVPANNHGAVSRSKVPKELSTMTIQAIRIWATTT